MTTNLGLMLENRAANAGSMEAFVNTDTGERMDYAALEALSNRVARVLLELGVGAGDRVALLQNNSALFVAQFFAAAKIGAVLVPLNTRLTATELAFILADSGAKTLVSDADFGEVLDALKQSGEQGLDVEHWLTTAPEGGDQSLLSLSERANADPVALAQANDTNLFIMYTSGTTGRPKGVVHTHASVQASACNWMATIDARFGDRIFLPLPMFHVAALCTVIFAVLRGITIVAMPKFDPAAAWDVMARERVNIGGSVPAVLNFMRQVPGFETFDASEFRFFITGAAPMPAHLIELYNQKGIEVVQGYALTESGGGGTFLMNEFALSKLGSAGTPSMFTQIALLDDSGERTRSGRGEVVMRGSHMMKEYWNRPDATAEAWVDGWFRTGDIAEIDEDGFVFIKDRLKDMIISGGENIYPAEVEAVLQSHAEIREVAVIGLPDERWGESVCAVVAADPDVLTEEALIEFCKQRLSRYKQPSRVAFMDALPRNATGKVLKNELRNMLGKAS